MFNNSAGIISFYQVLSLDLIQLKYLPMKVGTKISCIFCVVFFIGFQFSFSQNLTGLYNLIPGNTKEVDKAFEQITEAGKIIQEANDYYNEALELQSNYELDEKSLQKKLAKAENKALDLQLKADKLYAEAYKTLYEICLKTLKSSTVSYGEIDSYEESAASMVGEAAGKRRQASDTKNPYEKAGFLNDASGLDAAAIENLIAALQLQSGNVPETGKQDDQSALPEEDYVPPERDTILQPGIQEPSKTYLTQSENTSPVVDNRSENLAIDQAVIRKYQEYKNDPTIPDPITITRAGVSGNQDATMENAINVFYAMHTGNPMESATPTITTSDDQQKAIADSIGLLARESSKSSPVETHESTGNENLTLNEVSGAGETGKTNNDVTSKGTTVETKNVVPTGEAKKSREKLDMSFTAQNPGVRFMVQVAASKVPLTRSQLWAIYPGNLSVEVVEEGSWYKYRITNFRVFTDANRIALESGVKSAFVLATDGSQIINLVAAREMTRVLESDVRRYGDKAIKEGTDYFIQFAASRIRLSDEDKKSICVYAGTCREIIEEGWFKYQVYAGTRYDQALELKNQVSGKSFIVGYEKGTKIMKYRTSPK
jgi:hypothetical protein